MNRKRYLILVLCAVVLLMCVLVGIRYAMVKLPSKNKPTYTVNFYSDDGSLLLIDPVPEDEAANPPSVPDMTYGNVFTKWEQDITHITEDLDVYPIVESVHGKTNVFAIPSAYGRTGDSLVIPFQLFGDVCLCGFDLLVEYDPEKLTLEEVLNEDGGLIYNADSPGQIYMNFVNTENIEADIDICWLKFTILAEGDSTPISVTVNSIYELSAEEVCDDSLSSDEQSDDEVSSGELSDVMSTPEYNLITGTVYVLQ